MCSKTQKRRGCLLHGLIERRPVPSTITISPGSTSRTKRAPMMSSAQLSEVMIQASSSRPMQSGRTPIGSRTPSTDPCFYGIDTPERDKLLASRYDVAGMAKFIGVDSLAFLSIEGLYHAMGLPGRDPHNPGFCDACFTGDYPIALDDVNGVEDRQLSLLAEPA